MTSDDDDVFSAALRESEERYRTLFEQAPFGVFLYDRAMRITECNAAFCKLLGAPYDKLVGLELRRLKDQRVVPAIERVLEGEPSSYEGPYQSMLSGWIVQVHLRCSPLRDAEGDVIGGMGVVEDVTERLRAMEALRASEQWLSLHVKSSPLGVVGWSLDGRCMEWNDSATRIFGWTAAEMMGATVDRIVPEIARAKVLATATRLLARTGGERAVNENVTKDGRIILCDWYNSTLVDPQGKVIGIASLVQDITERQAAEEALKRSEARFRELIERAPEATFVSRVGEALEDSVFVYVNPALVSYLGFEDREALIGAPTAGRVHGDDRPAFVASELGRAHGTPAAPREYRLLRRDGSTVWAEVVSLLIDYDGAPAVLSFARDTTERRQMQVRLMQADRMVSVGTLAAGVAHEINNPLAYLLANVEHVHGRRLPQIETRLRRIEEECDEASRPQIAEVRRMLADVGEMLEIAREGADRVRTIVADLKTFSRADEERRGPVDVHRVLDASINMTWNEIRHSAQLVREYGETPLVDANEARLGQVFLNLLVNAAQAIPAGHARENEIRVRTSTDDKRNVRVEVHDSGCGIAEDALPRIFDPFYTTKPVGVGTGLGLWICQGIVTGLGGSITVESRTEGRAGVEGRASRSGTTFVVSLPGREEAPTSAEVSHGRESVGRRGRVLVVDDEPAIARALKNGLGDEHDVATAVSGHEALALLLDRDGDDFDVVLCDLMMPDLSGMELFERLRANKPDLAARVVFVTGGAFTAQAQAFVDRARVPRVEKPFDIARVRELVGGYVRRRAGA